MIPTCQACTRSHGPRDVGRVLLGLHAQHGYAGRAPLELGLGLKGVVAGGGRREEGVRAEEVVEGDVAELVLLVGEAHVAVLGGSGGRAGGVGVGGDAGRGASGQHAGRHHGAAGGRARPQVVGNLLGGGKEALVAGENSDTCNESVKGTLREEAGNAHLHPQDVRLYACRLKRK